MSSRAYLITFLEPFVTQWNKSWMGKFGRLSTDSICQDLVWLLRSFVNRLILDNLCCSKRIAKFLRIFVVSSNKSTRTFHHIKNSANYESFQLWFLTQIDINISTNSLVNADSLYANFSNTTFQKVPIPHLKRPMKQKFLH